MASRILRKVMSLSNGLVLVPGSFAVNGSSAIDATSNKGAGWTVAYTSTGLYTVTFADAYPNMLSFLAGIQLATASDKIIMSSTYDASAKTAQIRVWDVSDTALADLGTANANNRINFCAFFGNLSFFT